MGKSLPRDGDFQMQRMQVAVVGSWPDRCRVRWWAGAVAKSRWECVHESVGPGGLWRVRGEMSLARGLDTPLRSHDLDEVFLSFFFF